MHKLNSRNLCIFLLDFCGDCAIIVLEREVNRMEKQLYKLSFVTGFVFEMMLTEKELYNMIRTTKLCGYKKIVKEPLTE